MCFFDGFSPVVSMTRILDIRHSRHFCFCFRRHVHLHDTELVSFCEFRHHHADTRWHAQIVTTASNVKSVPSTPIRGKWKVKLEIGGGNDAVSTPSHSSFDGGTWSDSSPMENNLSTRLVASHGGDGGIGDMEVKEIVGKSSHRRSDGHASKDENTFESRFESALRKSMRAAQQQSAMIDTQLEFLSARPAEEGMRGEARVWGVVCVGVCRVWAASCVVTSDCCMGR
jgi:hypothetical protein